MSRRKAEMKGKTFGRWTVISEAGRNKHGQFMWTCRCECGTVKNINGITLRGGESKSCGCLKLDILLERSTTHGMHKTRFHYVWQNMMRRCYKEGVKAYKDYGGRGIKVDPRWHDFINFRDDLYDKYLKHAEEFGEKQTTLDRIDVNKNYELENVRFATWFQQAKNRRVRSTNTSGVTGVTFEKQTGRWKAQIFSDGVHRGLGSYKDFDEAVAARRKAEIELGFPIIQGDSE